MNYGSGIMKVSIKRHYGLRLTLLPLEDRVQWHRAWADMLRWLEEFELKHVEFIRCIRSFRSHQDAWAAAAASSPRAGQAAFARRQSATYRRLKEEAEYYFKKAGTKELREPNEVSAIIEAVVKYREKHLGWFRQFVEIQK
jgi:hypothetical protein